MKIAQRFASQVIGGIFVRIALHFLRFHLAQNNELPFGYLVSTNYRGLLTVHPDAYLPIVAAHDIDFTQIR